VSWLRCFGGLLLCLGTTVPIHAQAWDDRVPNIVAIGFGGSAGGLGARYLRQLGSVPLALGAGLGVLGPAVHVDLTLPGLEFRPLLGAGEEADDARAYFGVGLLVVANRVTNSLGGGELILEAGTQTWPRAGGDRFFTDMALGIMIRAWGPTNSSSLGPSLRAQVGYAF
jgi:hypothetical protein